MSNQKCVSNFDKKAEETNKKMEEFFHPNGMMSFNDVILRHFIDV
jgi:hypothetical protein